MYKKTFKSSAIHLALLGVIGVSLSGCGGGTGTVGTTTQLLGGAVTSGKVADGYVKNAVVTLDTNDNGICEATEPSVTSNATGDFSFATSLGNHMICSSGGTDIATNQPFVGQIKAPAGSTVVTPLTNIIMANLVAAMPVGTFTPPTALAVSNANTAITSKLSLGTVDLTKVDPLLVLSVLKSTTAVQQLVQQTTAALTTATGTTATTATNNAIYQAVANAVSAQLTASTTPVNLATSASTFAANVVTASVTALQTTPVTGVAATTLNAANTAAVVSASVANTVQQIASATSTATISAAATTAVTTGVAALQNTVTANTANVTSATAGLTNVVPGAGTFVNGTAAVAAVAGGVKSVATTAGVGITTASVNFGLAVGTPVITNPVSVAFDVSSTVAGDTRSFQGSISGLTLTNTAGVLTLAVPATATANVYGKHSTGAVLNGTATNATNMISGWIAPVAPGAANAGGGIQLNVGAILTALGTAYPTTATATGFSSLNLLKGNFNVTVVVSGVNSLSNGTSTALTPATSVSVTNATPGATTPVATVSGQGEVINVTVN
jgi:hypothetical protein